MARSFGWSLEKERFPRHLYIPHRPVNRQSKQSDFVRYKCVSVRNLLRNWRSISLVQSDGIGPGSKVNLYVPQQYLPAAKHRPHQIVSPRRHSRERSFTKLVRKAPALQAGDIRHAFLVVLS